MRRFLVFAVALIFIFSDLGALCAQSKPDAQKDTARIPFVGCKSDGQVGPLDAPNGKTKLVSVSEKDAGRLAYYQAKDGFGVLAPKGWYCFSTYGSSGSSLFVSPGPINSSKLFSSDWKGFEGPVIQISDAIGDTSGRFEVARIIARVFPTHKQFVQSVIDEGIQPASDFPFGAYRADRLKYRSERLVEYETPAMSEGLGTQSRLLKNSSPIQGIQFLVGSAPSLLSLAVRLPQEFVDLTPAILQQAEREGVRFKD